MSTRPLYLLILSPPAWPFLPRTLEEIYGPVLLAVLKRLSHESRQSTAGAVLDIAVVVPFSSDKWQSPKAALFSIVQGLIAGIYSLVCKIATKQDINVEDVEGIDVRVHLLQPPSVTANEGDGEDGSDGVRIPTNIQVLARSGRTWEMLFLMESDECEELLKLFLTSQDSRVKVQRVKGGTVENPEQAQDLAPLTLSSDGLRHHSIAVGGTFDHLHIGHKLLLTMVAFLVDSQVENEETCLTVGITGDELLKNKQEAGLLEDWHERVTATVAFLRAIMDYRSPSEELKWDETNEPGPNGHTMVTRFGPQVVVRCVELSDPFGPTITDESISALVVSVETRSGGKAVNDKREEKGWQALQILEVDVLDAGGDGSERPSEEAFASKLSSTSIRQRLRQRARKRRDT